LAGVAVGAVTPEEARQLGTTLTAVGAEQAGNEDGTIPQYTGGLTAPPPGYHAGDGIRPDPFAAEQPLFSIDANSLDRHAAKLTEGTKAQLRKYPTYRIDVYPTHRTAAFPQYVVDNTVKNATRAKTTSEGRSLQGAHARFPFPIPKDGYEAMWNHLLRFNGLAYESRFRVINVDAAARPTVGAEGRAFQEYPYWDPSKTDTAVYYRARVTYTGPARRAGEGLLVVDPIDFAANGRRAWIYLPGQRRVKLAPDVGYDTPNPSTAGATTYDDAFLFNGAMDRFDFRLVGKREMYIPYNTYRMAYHSKQAELFTPKHLNPDLVRWELHRVWVVEATLREGKRHLYSRRTFYLDEDSWVAVASDKYDARGELYRAGFAYVTPWCSS